MSRAKVDPADRVLNLFLDLPRDEKRALLKTLGILIKREDTLVSLRKGSLRHAAPAEPPPPTVAPVRKPRRRAAAAQADPGPVAEVG